MHPPLRNSGPLRRSGMTTLASILALSLVLPPLLSVPSHAQEEPAASVTPPVRVGRLAWTRGSVSFRPAGQDGWDPAVVNYPVNSGDLLWTQPGAAAGMQVSDTLIALAPSTEFDLDRFDTTTLAATEPEGELCPHRRILPGETYTLATPRGSVTIATPGRYEIAAGTTASPTLVTVLQGAARIEGPEAVTLRSGQTAQITGDQAFTVQIGPAMRDAFLGQMLARERPQPRPAVAPPALVAAMPGGVDLDTYGTWASSPDYGRSGIRRSPPAGCRTGRVTGPTSRPGAGPGSTTNHGVSHPSITVAGWRSGRAGPGYPRPWRWWPTRHPIRCMRRHWSRFSTSVPGSPSGSRRARCSPVRWAGCRSPRSSHTIRISGRARATCAR